MIKNKSILAYAALGLGILALSFSAMFVRWANAPGPITGFYRVLFSSILFTPFFIYRRKTFASIEARWLWLPAVAGLFTACDFAVWNSSLKYTTAANATLLGNTSPLWVSLAALLIFREKLRASFWIGLVCALTGAALIVGGDFLYHPTLGIGNLMAILASLFYAAYQLTTQRGRKHIDAFPYAWIVGLSAAFGIFFINLILGNSFTGYSTQTWIIFLVTAIVSQMIGYLSVSYALGHLPASVVSPTLIGQPILTTILAIPLLGEIPSASQWIGGAIALAGIYVINQSHLHTESETPNA